MDVKHGVRMLTGLIWLRTETSSGHFMNTVLYQVRYLRNFFTSWTTVNFSKRTLLHWLF